MFLTCEKTEKPLVLAPDRVPRTHAGFHLGQTGSRHRVTRYRPEKVYSPLHQSHANGLCNPEGPLLAINDIVCTIEENSQPNLYDVPQRQSLWLDFNKFHSATRRVFLGKCELTFRQRVTLGKLT